MAWEKVLSWLLNGTVFAALVAIIGKAMGWVRFNKIDKAKEIKIKSETQIDMAEVANKKTEDEVKISKAALEWAVQLAGQLEKANIINEKRQVEIDRLHTVIHQMRADFEKQMDEVESTLEQTKKECLEEREKYLTEKAKNDELIKQLNKYLNGTNGTT